MSITSAKTGATGISLALENNFMEPIATAVVGAGGVNQITFMDIPQTYKHLHLRVSARSNRASNPNDSVVLYLNNDISNYSYHDFGGDGSGIYQYGQAAPGLCATQMSAADSINSNIMGISLVDILDYSNTSKNKVVRNIGGVDGNGSGRVAMMSSAWLDSTGIFSIKIAPQVGTSWYQHSRFSLYGIKG
jgi:hypothetical protein